MHIDKICDTCRKEIGLTVQKLNEKKAEEQDGEQLMDVDLDVDNLEPCVAVQNLVSSSSIDFIDRDWFLRELNKILPHIGVELIDMTKVWNKSRSYCDGILKSIHNNLARKNFEIPENSSETHETNTCDEEMLCQLKEKFTKTSDKDSKVKILSVLPISWSVRKIEREFDTSRRLADLTKIIVAENGILSGTRKRVGN